MENHSLESKLKEEARYLMISIPYDVEDGLGLIAFDDGMGTELQYEEGFLPPMFDSDNQTLEVIVDLQERKALDWDEKKGYIHMWAKLCDSGIYTLLDADEQPLCQIAGYVPNALVPPYERGFGDYLELTIESDGTLPDWKSELDFSDFIDEGQTTFKEHRPKSCGVMNEYIFYTPEGFTTAPNEDIEAENCQMLGTAKGKDVVDAKKNLLKENPWITEAGFEPTQFITRQLVTDEQRSAIKELLDYLWEDEKRHYEESECPENHIFKVMKVLKSM